MKNLMLFISFIFFLTFTSCDGNKKKEAEIKQGESAESNEQEEKVSSKDPVILFFGNSLTAGMGVEPDQAFPALIEDKIDSLGLPYTVINAGLSGETTASGKNRLDWVLNQKVDIFVLELGANDGLRGIPLEETRSNLQTIIDRVREKNPDTEILLAGMQIPPNLGLEYTTEFREIFFELAEKNELYLIPFLLKGVAGEPELNQEDGIHPTAKGHEILAENVWEVLKPLVTEKSPSKSGI
ncbi:MAG TPA: arylesterase [Salinimicrobium sp.]|nr:arylesterase [Salinimicrobium sp.]